MAKAAHAGDRKAYSELLESSARLIRPYLTKRLARAGDVDDVLQEVLISLHKARHTYDGERPYKPWLFAIARYRLNDYLRSHYSDHLARASELEDALNISPENVTESGFTYESIHEEVARLPGKQPVILQLLHRDGHTAKEAAKVMNMTESAVKVAAHRAYKVLRKKLANER